MSTITYTATLTVIACGECGVLFAMDDRFISARKEDHGTWYCPNGHRRFYPAKNEVEEAQAQLKRERDNAARLRSQLDQQRARADHNEARARGYKGAMVQAKKRAAKGVCPVPGCRRHFVDVQRHIESKHPNYTEVEA